MDLPQIIILECLTNLSHIKCFISVEQLDDLYQFKFDTDGDTSITKHASLFPTFYKHYENYNEYMACILLCITVEVQVNRWYHTLPHTSIHSFEHLIKELDLSFGGYDYQHVVKRINQFIMNPNELIEYFYNRFLHLCYEFHDEYTDWDVFKKKMIIMFISLFMEN